MTPWIYLHASIQHLRKPGGGTCDEDKGGRPVHGCDARVEDRDHPGFHQPAVIHFYELFGLMLAVILMLSVVGGRLAHRGRTH